MWSTFYLFLKIVLNDQAPKSSFSQRWELGASNINLWVNGLLYPHDPLHHRCPQLWSVSQLHEFIAEEKNGLLRCIARLYNKDSQIEFSLNEAQREVSMLQESMQQFVSVCKERDWLLIFIRLETSIRERIAKEN